MAAAAAAGKGRSSRPQSISKAEPNFWLGTAEAPFMSFGTPVQK